MLPLQPDLNSLGRTMNSCVTFASSFICLGVLSLVVSGSACVIQATDGGGRDGGAGGGTAVGVAGGGGVGGGGVDGGSGDPDGLPDPVVTGHVLRVCAVGCDYTLPSLALAAAVDGDTIEIHSGDYVDCAFITRNNLVLRGVLSDQGLRPKIHSKVCDRKGIFVVQSEAVLIENLELSDAIDPTTTDENWACIRLDSLATARDLKVRNCWLHDADNGLLGNNISTAPNTVVVETSLLEQLGRAGYAHGLYLGAAVDLFVLRDSVVRSNRLDGHLVKSRAKRTVVECSTVAALEGLSSFGIDLPQGGNATLRGNVIQAGTRVSNSGNLMVNFAQENGDNAPHRLLLTDNVFINDFRNQGRINIARPADTSGWANNTYAGTGGSLLLVNYTGSAVFTNFDSRAAAGFPAYDMTIASLPGPSPCH
jgi:hypothetical protein